MIEAIVTSDILSLPAAREIGAKLYFTGKPCRHGHLAARRVVGNACVECNRLRRIKWGEDHPDRAMAWRERNPDRVREINNRFYANHKEERKAHVRRWMVANKGYRAEWKAEWMKRNRESVRASLQKRRAIKSGSGGGYTGADVEAIRKAQRGKCAYCGVDLSRVERHVDHILPLALGGRNVRTNIQLTCAPCNLAKAAKHPAQFAQELGLLI